jgi:hypothetical protein
VRHNHRIQCDAETCRFCAGCRPGTKTSSVCGRYPSRISAIAPTAGISISELFVLNNRKLPLGQAHTGEGREARRPQAGEATRPERRNARSPERRRDGEAGNPEPRKAAGRSVQLVDAASDELPEQRVPRYDRFVIEGLDLAEQVIDAFCPYVGIPPLGVVLPGLDEAGEVLV